MTPRTIDIQNFIKQNFHICLALEQRSQWSGNVGWRKRTGGHLVEQRLKEMKITPVQKRDLQWRSQQSPRGFQTAKPATHNHDVMKFFIHSVSK